MEGTLNKELKIDPELEEYLWPLTPEEYSRLEKMILKDGCREPIVECNGYIVDGYHRYKICNELGIDYLTIKHNFPDKESAQNWMMQNQAARRNTTKRQMSYIRGKMYELNKKGVGEHIGNQYTQTVRQKEKAQIDPIPEVLGNTAENIGNKFKASASTIKRDVQFSKAVDEIAKNAGKSARLKILSGEVKMSSKGIIAFSQKDPEIQKKTIDEFTKGTKKIRKPKKKNQDKTSVDLLQTVRNLVLLFPVENIRDALNDAANEKTRTERNGEYYEIPEDF